MDIHVSLKQSLSQYHYQWCGEPERAPNTRERGSGFMIMYICLWDDHFSEKRAKI